MYPVTAPGKLCRFDGTKLSGLERRNLQAGRTCIKRYTYLPCENIWKTKKMFIEVNLRSLNYC